MSEEVKMDAKARLEARKVAPEEMWRLQQIKNLEHELAMRVLKDGLFITRQSKLGGEECIHDKRDHQVSFCRYLCNDCYEEFQIQMAITKNAPPVTT